jgi:hypothetical protein
MCAARRERLTREAIGGMQVPFPENTIRNLTLVGLVLLVAIAFAPPREKRPVFAGSPIDAHAATMVHPASAAQPAEASAEGNVVDMTY